MGVSGGVVATPWCSEPLGNREVVIPQVGGERLLAVLGQGRGQDCLVPGVRGGEGLLGNGRGQDCLGPGGSKG